MNVELVAIVIGGVLVAVLFGVLRWRRPHSFARRLPTVYGCRDSQHQAWRQRYGDEAMAQIDNLLTIFAEAFLFDLTDRYQVTPDDRLGEVYAAKYGASKVFPRGDVLEIETLILELSRCYGEALSTFDDKTTLGELPQAVLSMDRQSDQHET